MVVPYLAPDVIDLHADQTRADAYAAGVAVSWPFDIESAVEFHFGYRLNLCALLPAGVHGMLDADTHVLSVSGEVIYDGRRRFTVAHEVGHLVLHIPLLTAQSRQPTLFAIEPHPYTDRRAEWQADAFAAAILMPTSAMLHVFGGKAQAGGWIDPQAVATMFGVSKQAAELRLKGLGMLYDRPRGHSLEM